MLLALLVLVAALMPVPLPRGAAWPLPETISRRSLARFRGDAHTPQRRTRAPPRLLCVLLVLQSV
jgi:hypothetical protein